MFKIIRVLFFIFVSTVFLNCTRNVETNSNVSLSFPNLNQVGAMTCTTCLKYIVVKVEGDGFDKIVTKVSAENIQDTSEVSGEFTYSIPPGLNRKFKAAAIYILNGTHILAAGETSVDLPDTEFKEVNITMQTQGEVHGGSLVGRYITGQLSGGTIDTGPTGDVDVILNYNSDPDFDMFIQKVPILNGWFDFMASENLAMTYKIADQNLVLFQNVSLNSLVPLTGAPTLNHIARVVRPETYYRDNGTASWELNDEKHDVIYGFFSPTAAHVIGKFVCLEYASGPTNLSKVASNITGSGLLSYSHNNPAANFYGISGRSNISECAGSTSSDRYTSNRISINKNQLDGNGNDHAKAFGNAFTYTASPTYHIQKYNYSNGIFNLTALPGLFGNSANYLFNNIQLYSKPNAADGGLDDLQCDITWLGNNGFSPLTATTTLAGDNLTFQLGSMIASTDGTVACPTKDEGGVQTLQTKGGFYLGGLQYSNLSAAPGHIATPSPGFVYINIMNTGNKTANSLNGALAAGPISFFNGSFNAAGNCSTQLAPGATCQIKLIASVSGSENLIITYDDGVLTVPITSGP